MTPSDMQRRARAKAAALRISLAEYVRRLVADESRGAEAEARDRRGKADISIVFDLVGDGRATNVARDKDKMIGSRGLAEPPAKNPPEAPRPLREKQRLSAFARLVDREAGDMPRLSLQPF